MHARDIINLFGNQSTLARALGKSQSTISYWAKTGVVPASSHTALLALAAERRIDLSGSDFTASNEIEYQTPNRN